MAYRGLSSSIEREKQRGFVYLLKPPKLSSLSLISVGALISFSKSEEKKELSLLSLLSRLKNPIFLEAS